MMIKLLSCSFLLSGLLCLAAADSPSRLDKVESYSLEITPDGPTENYFPVGTLRGTDIQKTRSGLNWGEESLCDYQWKDGSPMHMLDLARPSGSLFHMGSWGAHTFAFTTSTRDFGDVTYVLDEDGKLQNLYHVTLFNPNFRRYIAAYDGELAGLYGSRYGRDQLYMWSLDNEWQGMIDYQPLVIELYRRWLEKRYGSLDELNRVWRSAYASFDEIEPPPQVPRRRPEGTEAVNWLNWYYFQSENFSDVIRERFEAMHRGDPLHRPVGLKAVQGCIDFSHWTKRKLHNFSDLAEKTRDFTGGWLGCDVYGNNDAFEYEISFLDNCARPTAPDDSSWYGVNLFETNNHGGPGWQFADTFWRSLGNGLKAVDFFCMGDFGDNPSEDPEVFGFIARNGRIRERYFYVPRFATMLHRSEKFWKQARAAEVPRVALLNSHRDNLLEDDPGGVWDAGENSRQALYARLRNLGYWVDVLPYHKLTPEFLKQYQVLFLCNAELLTDAEFAAVAEYIENGGKVLGDLRCGYFNENLEVRPETAAVFGVGFQAKQNWHEKVPLSEAVSSRTRAFYTPAGAELSADGLIACHRYGDGRSLLLATGLGAWRNPAVKNASGDPKRIDAGTEADEILQNLLDRLEVEPPAAVAGRTMPAIHRQVRVETPQADEDGNLALLIGNNVEEGVGEVAFTLTLPEDTATRAFWAPAEEYALYPLEFDRLADGRFHFTLPGLGNAGVVYCFREHAPLLGQKTPASAVRAVDGRTPKFRPGEKFTWIIQLAAVNPTGGELRLTLPDGWSISPSAIAVEPLEAGQFREFEVQAQVTEDLTRLEPNQPFPMLAEYFENGERVAVCNQVVEIDFPEEIYESASRLLSDNNSVPEGYFLRKTTGATYRIVRPDGSPADCDDEPTREKPLPGLIDGHYGWWTRRVDVRSPEVEVIFDLNDVYTIDDVRVFVQEERFYQSLEVRCSTDGVHYTAPVVSDRKLQPVPRGGWNNVVELPDAPDARYVKIIIRNPGGAYHIDDIQIWGKTHPAARPDDALE